MSRLFQVRISTTNPSLEERSQKVQEAEVIIRSIERLQVRMPARYPKIQLLSLWKREIARLLDSPLLRPQPQHEKDWKASQFIDRCWNLLRCAFGGVLSRRWLAHSSLYAY